MTDENINQESDDKFEVPQDDSFTTIERDLPQSDQEDISERKL